jgi:hypothetical protein
MRAAGAGWVRVNFRLGRCFPDWATAATCTGRPATDAYDAVLARAEASGLRVVGLLSNESWHGRQRDWLANNAEFARGSGDNAYVRGFAEGAAGPLARRYAGRVAAWEVWNEPNAWNRADGTGRFAGGSFLYPSNFAWLLARSHAQITTADPAAQVISGGLFSHDTRTPEPGGLAAAPVPAAAPGQPGATDPAPSATGCRSALPDGADTGAGYLCATYQAGLDHARWRRGAFPFDRVGQHFYLDFRSATTEQRLTAYLDDLQRAVTAYEGRRTDTRLVVTEFGWTAQAVSLPVQAHNLDAACAAFAGHPFVERAFWFTIEDVPEAAQYFGLLRRDGVPKPAHAAFQRCAG